MIPPPYPLRPRGQRSREKSAQNEYRYMSMRRGGRGEEIEGGGGKSGRGGRGYRGGKRKMKEKGRRGGGERGGKRK